MSDEPDSAGEQEADKKIVVDIGLKQLSKTAEIFVKKICDAMGTVWEPAQNIIMAKSNARVRTIELQNKLDLTEIESRAMNRLIDKETRHQENIESIAQLSLSDLNEDANPEAVEDDWITSFFEESQNISDADMQSLWAKILAGEVNSPGTFKKRTFKAIALLDKEEAEVFTALISMSIRFQPDAKECYPLIFAINESIYQDSGITHDAIINLESLGLLKLDHLSGFQLALVSGPQKFHIFHHSIAISIELSEPPTKISPKQLKLGKVMLTQTGQQLANIIEGKMNPDFFPYMMYKLQQESAVKVGVVHTMPSRNINASVSIECEFEPDEDRQVP